VSILQANGWILKPNGFAAQPRMARESSYDTRRRRSTFARPEPAHRRPRAGVRRRPGDAVAQGRVAAVMQTGGALQDLTIAETLQMTASLYREPRPVPEVLERAGLAGIADRLVGKYSGGEQQRVGARYIRFTSCDLRVLTDQPTQPIPLHDPASRRQANWLAGPKRWRLPQRAVGAVAVAMVDVLGQYRPQLPAAQDQRPIQYLPADRAHPALRVGVGSRRPHRRAQHLDPLGGEDGVERGGELRPGRGAATGSGRHGLRAP
jgi:hypothetical protein